MSQHDSNFYKPFVFVLGALVIFTLFIIAMANLFSPKADHAADPIVMQRILQQIAPVGKSRVKPTRAVAVVEKVADDTTAVAEQPVEQEVAVAAPADDTVANAAPVAPAAPVETIPLRVKAVVATNCAGCHLEGISGAPRIDDRAAWQALAEQGVSKLTASVIEGRPGMPSRAETTLSDEELRLSVVHLLHTTTGALPQQQDPPTAALAEVVPATAIVPAKMESTAMAVVVASAEVAASSGNAAEPPEHIKAQVNSLCASCHISGAGNAPKFGDKAAWAQRTEQGMDALLASAIAGKGAMPPRGGSQLSDEDLLLAIQYMLTK